MLCRGRVARKYASVLLVKILSQGNKDEGKLFIGNNTGCAKKGA